MRTIFAERRKKVCRNLKSARHLADSVVMLSSAQILDRGRLLVGLLLVVPAGVLLVPSGRSSGETAAAPPVEWGSAQTVNPIAVEGVTAQDVLTNLTTRPGVAPPVDRTVGDSPATTDAAQKVQGEVGSESVDTKEPSAGSPAGSTTEQNLAALTAAQGGTVPASQPSPDATPAPADGPTPLATPASASYTPPAGATHVFPVVGGASFSNDWGALRAGGRRHEGIDLLAKSSAPVIAVSDGTLFKVGWNSAGGWRFWLRDRWGNTFYYAHLSAFAPVAKEGATVRAGTVIGFVGNSGDAKKAPPHLHFEIHPVGATATPPFPFVSVWPRV